MQRELLSQFLATHDAPCPRCGYNLRGSELDRCPECALPIQLGLLHQSPQTRFWESVAAIAMVISALYFAAMTVFQARSALGPSLVGSSMAALRASYLLSAGTDLFMFVLAGGWCAAIWLLRNRWPRPAWARPTSAAAGILLGTFVAYLILYSTRALVLRS